MNQTGEYFLEGMSWGMAVDGNVVMIGHDNESAYDVHVVDVTDPATPQLMGTVGIEDMPVGLAVSGDRGYVAHNRYDSVNQWCGALIEIDLSDAALPVVNSLLTDEMPNGFALNGNVGYLMDMNGLNVVDIDSFSIVDTFGDLRGSLMVIEGNRAYMSGGGNAVSVLDVTDPEAPVQLGAFTNPFEAGAQDMEVSDGHVGLTAGGMGVILLNASVPEEIELLAVFDTGDWAEGIAVQGQKAFLADGEGGLLTVDVTSYTDPIHDGTCVLDGYARRVEVVGDNVYVLVNETGLKIFDKSQI